MKGIYWQTLTFKKSVIYLIKVNYTSYNYTPCNSTWTCLIEKYLDTWNSLSNNDQELLEWKISDTKLESKLTKAKLF